MGKVKERFAVEVNGSTFQSADDDLDGRQVRSLSGHDPAADFRLIRIHDRYTAALGLEDPIHLEEGEVPRFRCMEGDADYPFTVDDRGWEWGAPSIGEAEVRTIGRIAEDRELVVSVIGDDDLVVPRGGTITLSGRGVERIYSRKVAAPKKIGVTFVVNGVPVPVEGRPGDTLLSMLEKALKKSENTGQPADAWQVTDEPGNLLDVAATLSGLGIRDGAVLLASLKTGAAG